jgi:SAM-dependent methyltransferase
MALRSSLPRNDPARGGGRRAVARTFTVDTGIATLVRDGTRRNAWTLLLDGVESSHVDLDDPTLLIFEYVRWFGDIIDCLTAPGERLDTVHLGGGAVTLARYIAATRPASTQVVFEVDAALIELVRAELPWPRNPRLRIRIGDARAGLASLRPDAFDVVVRDAFRDAAVPPHLRTVEFALQVKAVLRGGGIYLINVADRGPFARLGAELATAFEAFAYVAVVSEPGVLRGRRHGNLVVAAADEPLPVDAIARRIADGGVQGRVRDLGEARAMARGHAPLVDADLS